MATITVLNVVIITLVPAAAMLIGAAIAAFWSPSGSVQSGIQHFTAGVVIAAVAVELVPELHVAEQPIAMAVGFLVGIALMLTVRTIFDEEPAGAAAPASTPAKRSGMSSQLPALSLLAAVGVDVFVDGLVSGVTLAAIPEGGRVIIAALSLEVLFLGMATAATLRRRGSTLVLSMLIVGGLALLIPLGGLMGPVTLAVLPPSLQTSFLAFATAAFLYLVFEELFAEAHAQGPDSNLTTSMLFVGFLLVLLIKAYLH
ncbi:MAG: hypothetical protein WBG92_22305 [Thiohalocapsa sp.]